MSNLLLLSNSTLPGTPYLEWAAPHIDQFLGEVRTVLFVPYAAVGFSYEKYTEMLQNGLDGRGITVKSIHEAENKLEAVAAADAIAVGGGNTFQLLKLMQEQGLTKAIHDRVTSGALYMGWSAGANVGGPSIKTTNDMPIAQPLSFDAIGLFPWQINPHYTEKKIDGHGGESRKQRLKEYCAMNDIPVICLPEGTGVKASGNSFELIGHEAALVLQEDQEKTIQPGPFSI